MGSKKVKKKKQQKKKKEDFGSATFYCQHCGHTFEVEWETIWDIQEATHGYVGFDLNGVWISCPKCGEIVDNDALPPGSKDDIFLYAKCTM